MHLSLQFSGHTSFSTVTLYLSLLRDDVTSHTLSSICLFNKIYCHVLMVKCLLCMSINLFVFFLLVSFISRSNALSLVIFISVSIKLSTLLLILLFVYIYVNIQRKASTYQMYHSQYTKLPRDKVSSL